LHKVLEKLDSFLSTLLLVLSDLVVLEFRSLNFTRLICLRLLLAHHLLVLVALVELDELVVELLNVWQLHVHLGLPVVLADLESEVALPHVVIKGTDFEFVATLLVTLDPFVLVRMVKAFDGGVALDATKSVWAKVPTDTLDECIAVFRVVLKDVRWSAEVTHVVRVNAALGVV